MFPFSPKTAPPKSNSIQPVTASAPKSIMPDPSMVGAKIKYVSKFGKTLTGAVVGAIPGGYEVVTGSGKKVLIRTEAVLGGISPMPSAKTPPLPSYISAARTSPTTVQFKVGDVVLYSGREFQVTAIQDLPTTIYYELNGLAWVPADQLTLSMSAPVAVAPRKVTFCTCGEQWVSGVSQIDRHSGWCDLKVDAGLRGAK